MRVETAFTDQIAKLKRRTAVACAHGILLNAGLIFLGLRLLLFIAAIAGLAPDRMHGSWYMASIGISLSTAVLIGFVTRRNFLDVLIEIDRRLNLQDRLSTAYEYLTLKKDSEFTDLLRQDAAAVLNRLNSRQLLPVRFSRRYLIVIFLLIANAALYKIDNPVSNFKSAPAEQKMIEQAGALLRNYTFRRIENKAGEPSGRHTAFSRKLEQLGNQIDDRSLTADQLLTSLAGTLEEVQAERSRLADELATRLNAAGIRELPVRQIPALENLSPDQLADLKGLLNKALNSRVPDAGEEDIESLQELDRIAKLLSRIMDDVNKDRSENAESAAAAEDESQTSQVAGGTEDVRNDLQQSIADGHIRNHERSGPDMAGEPGSDRRGENDGQFENDESMRTGNSSSAGRGESDGEKNPSADIEKSTGPATPDKMASAPVKSYLVHIRALTDIGEARLQDEDIVRTYSREVESILHKEDIPLNYREYIKNYFMAIGLNTEE